MRHTAQLPLSVENVRRLTAAGGARRGAAAESPADAFANLNTLPLYTAARISILARSWLPADGTALPGLT
jgi:hypothetical protein